MIIRYKWIARQEVQKNDDVVAKMIRNPPVLQAAVSLPAGIHTLTTFEHAAMKSAEK
jgi:hypothetical protein